MCSRNQNRPFVPGRKVVTFRGATLIRLCRTSRPTDRREAFGRRCPISPALCAGAYLVARCVRWVRRLTGPFVVLASPACTIRRISVLAQVDYSSRSLPCIRLSPKCGRDFSSRQARPFVTCHVRNRSVTLGAVEAVLQ